MNYTYSAPFSEMFAQCHRCKETDPDKLFIDTDPDPYYGCQRIRVRCTDCPQLEETWTSVETVKFDILYHAKLFGLTKSEIVYCANTKTNCTNCGKLCEPCGRIDFSCLYCEECMRADIMENWINK